MKSAIVTCLAGSVLSFAAGLTEFKPGQPARALEINSNFRQLDSAMQTKASQAGMDALAALVNTKAEGALRDSLAAISARIRRDSAAFAGYQAKLRVDSLSQSGKVGQISSGLGSKADLSALVEFKSKVKQDSASTAALISGVPTNANIASKLEASTFSTFQAKVKSDSGEVAGQIGNIQSTVAGLPTVAMLDLKLDASESPKLVRTGDAAHLSRVFFNSTVGDLVDEGTWYGMGRSNIPSLSSTPSLEVGSQMQVAGYFGLRLRSAAHILDLPEASFLAPTLDGKELWHSGNLDPAAFVTTKGPVFAGSEANEITTVFNDNSTLETSAGLLASIRHALDFRWYDSHWQIGNVRSGAEPSAGFGITNGNSDLRVLVGLTETRIFGDLVLPTGKFAAATASMGDLRITGKLTTPPGATPADYVFEPDYDLASLAEIEAFTKANKHLPEVPSASEMTKNGVDVAGMNMILLKKVEELTLHAIEQQKVLEAQRSDLADQKARLDRLEAMRGE